MKKRRGTRWILGRLRKMERLPWRPYGAGRSLTRQLDAAIARKRRKR